MTVIAETPVAQIKINDCYSSSVNQRL